MTTRRAIAVGLAVLLSFAACGPRTPSASPPPTSAPLTSAPTASPTLAVTPAPATPPAATAQSSAGDLPEMDPVATFGAHVKLTGTDTYLPGDIARVSVLALTGGHFGAAAECIGQGSLTIEVTRPVAPDPGYVVLASYRVPCPTSLVESLTNATGEVDPKTSLNVSVAATPGLYWRAILVDLEP